MFDYCSKSEDESYGGIVSMFAICHLTPAYQLNLFGQIRRIL